MAGHSAIGTAGPVFEVPLERGKVHEYAQAAKSQHPAYIADRAPPVPATFLVTAGFLWGYTLEHPGDTPLADVELDTEDLLHAEETFEFHGPPPRAGVTLQARTRIADVFEKQGRRGGTLTFIVSETTFHDGSGRLVALERSTAVKPARTPTE